MKFESMSDGETLVFVSRRFYKKSHLFILGKAEYLWMIQQWSEAEKKSGIKNMPNLRFFCSKKEKNK